MSQSIATLIRSMCSQQYNNGGGYGQANPYEQQNNRYNQGADNPYDRQAGNPYTQPATSQEDYGGDGYGKQRGAPTSFKPN